MTGEANLALRIILYMVWYVDRLKSSSSLIHKTLVAFLKHIQLLKRRESNHGMTLLFDLKLGYVCLFIKRLSTALQAGGC